MSDPTLRVLEAFKSHLLKSGMARYTPLIDDSLALKELANFLLVKGVKIGGIYEHWKGVLYQVTGMGRNADHWDIWEVEYVQIDDVTHKGHRTVEEFLEIHPEKNVPRFRLIE